MAIGRKRLRVKIDCKGCVNMGKRVLIVGGVAGGASAAARVRRLDADASITIFERGEHVSFSNCSLPYYLSRTVEDKDWLVLMTPEGFKASYDIEVRVNNEVYGIDRERQVILVRDSVSGREYEEAYDELVLSPGSYPITSQSWTSTCPGRKSAMWL